MTVPALTEAKSGLTRRIAAALVIGVGAAVGLQAPAMARGPTSVADIAAELLDSVVNVSTSQTVAGSSDAAGTAAAGRLAVPGFLRPVLRSEIGRPTSRAGCSRWAPASSSTRPA